MVGSPWYWALVGTLALVFTAVDLDALSRRRMGRVHGASVVVYVAAWAILIGLSLPVAPLGAIWWVLPFALRLAVAVVLGGSELLTAAIQTEQEHAHPEPAEPPPHRLTPAELQAAETYDAEWHELEHERERELQRDADRAHRVHHHPRVAFEHLVEEALRSLPSDIRAQMTNVAVVVEDEPPAGQRLLGLYHGVPLTHRSRGYAGALPDKITIYRGPLERHYGDDASRLAREVQRVVRHEVAHHFGISDERLIEMDRY